MIKTLVMAALLLIAAVNVKADCTASFSSSPDDTFGQRFNCDDGSTMTYKRNNISGDSLEHRDNQTGQIKTYRADGLSDTSDEYNGFGGRNFNDGNDSFKLKRGGFSNDHVEGVGDSNW